MNNYFFNLLKDDLKRKGKDQANEFKSMIKDFDFDKHFDNIKSTFNHKQSDMRDMCDMTCTPSKDGTYSFLIEVPGFAKNEIDINLDKGVLKVNGDNTKKEFSYTTAVGDDTVSGVTLELGILTINMNEAVKVTKSTKINID